MQGNGKSSLWEETGSLSRQLPGFKKAATHVMCILDSFLLSTSQPGGIINHPHPDQCRSSSEEKKSSPEHIFSCFICEEQATLALKFLKERMRNK